MLANAGWSAHFITDTGRNGVQPTAQAAWGDWCNLIGTGFGVRPTTNTGDTLEDAFVWVKPGGEGDGTSDSTADRYDFHCGASDALQPAPQAGSWFEVCPAVRCLSQLYHACFDADFYHIGLLRPTSYQRQSQVLGGILCNMFFLTLSVLAASKVDVVRVSIWSCFENLLDVAEGKFSSGQGRKH